MTLNQHYRNAVFYPSICAIVLIVILSIIDNYDYKSEWLTSSYVIFLSIVYALIYSLIIQVLSLPIFLIRYPGIRGNILFTALCWFLLPFGFITIVFIHEVSFNLKYEGKLGIEFIYTITLNLPYVIGLLWGYLRYRRSNASPANNSI